MISFKSKTVVKLSTFRLFVGQKLMYGKTLSGPGRLTLSMVDSFQVWYDQAPRKNKGNTDRMSTETKQFCTTTRRMQTIHTVRMEETVSVNGKQTMKLEIVHIHQ